MHYQLTILRNPKGTYSYVGSVPTALCYIVKASTSDIMGGRAFKDEKGNIVTWRAPVFDTQEEAVIYAQDKGFNPATQ